MIRKPEVLIATNCDIVARAADVIYTTGSRSRDEGYLRLIEERLRANPALVYIRVLMGPVRRKEVKDHLLRVFEFRSPIDRTQGLQTLYVGLYTDLARQPEIFLCGSEKRCLVVLPPLDRAGGYSTARVFTRRDDVESYRHLVAELYAASTQLLRATDIEALPIDPIPA